ncbi:MAG TPA: VOC family protein [Candidatus Sulfotelmatobacter sp.]|nr:VOC family protein [Candidatus Sulfotelmatobacter sp.]
MAASIQLARIAAIMLGVRDLPQALEFYKEKLGLQPIMQEPSLALLQCGGVMLGLSRGHVNLAPHVAGATEVVFAVENVRAAHKELSARGITFMSEPRQATPTDWVAHFKDPDGHILSVFGPEGQA